MKLSRKYSIYTLIIIVIFISVFKISLDTIHFLTGETSNILDISYELDYLTNIKNVLANLDRSVEHSLNTLPGNEYVSDVKQNLVELEIILKYSAKIVLNDEKKKTMKFASDKFDEFSSAVYRIINNSSRTVQQRKELYEIWKKDYIKIISSETERYRREDLEKLNMLYNKAKDAKDRSTQVFILTAAAILVFLIVSRFILSMAVIRPIKIIEDASKAIARGDTGNRIGVSSNDELGSLSGNINIMAEAIEDKIKRLKESLSKEQAAVSEQTLLKELMGYIASGKEINIVLNAFLEGVRELFSAEHSTIYILENTKEGKDPEIKFFLDTSIRKTPLSQAGVMLKGVLTDSLKKLVPVRINTPVDETPKIHSNLNNMLAIPISSTDSNLLGLVVLVNKKGGFTQDDEGRLLNFFSQAFDAIIIHQQIVRVTVTDELTGLCNHRFFITKLNDEIKRAEKFLTIFSLIMIDIDDFRKLNDMHGYKSGDTALKILAELISKNIKSKDITARYGSEEFAIILPETTVQQALIVAERLRKRIKRDSFLLGDNQRHSLTVSIGYASFPDDADKSDTLIKRAEQGIDLAKKNGKDRVCRYNESFPNSPE